MCLHGLNQLLGLSLQGKYTLLLLLLLLLLLVEERGQAELGQAEKGQAGHLARTLLDPLVS